MNLSFKFFLRCNNKRIMPRSLWETLPKQPQKQCCNKSDNTVCEKKEMEKKSEKVKYKIRKPKRREENIWDWDLPYINSDTDEESDFELDPLLKLKLAILQKGLKKGEGKKEERKEEEDKKEEVKKEEVKEDEDYEDVKTATDKDITDFLVRMIERTGRHKFKTKSKRSVLQAIKVNPELYQKVKKLYDNKDEIIPQALYSITHDNRKNVLAHFNTKNVKIGSGIKGNEKKETLAVSGDDSLYSQGFFEYERREAIYEKYPEFRNIKKASEVLKFPEETKEEKERKKWAYTLVYGVPYYLPHSKKVRRKVMSEIGEGILDFISYFGWLINPVIGLMGDAVSLGQTIRDAKKDDPQQIVDALKEAYDKLGVALKTEQDLEGLGLDYNYQNQYWGYIDEKEREKQREYEGIQKEGSVWAYKIKQLKEKREKEKKEKKEKKENVDKKDVVKKEKKVRFENVEPIPSPKPTPKPTSKPTPTPTSKPTPKKPVKKVLTMDDAKGFGEKNK